MGLLVSAQGFGSFLGGLTWGPIADKIGRRFNAIGFVFTAVFICAYFLVPSHVLTLVLLGFGYGFALACTYSWAVYSPSCFQPTCVQWVHLSSMPGASCHSSLR